MANRIRVSTDAMEKWAADLKAIQGAISEAAGVMSGIALDKASGGELKVSANTTLRCGARIGGSTAAEVVRSLEKTVRIAGEDAMDVSQSVLSAVALFEDAENEALSIVHAVGIGKGVDSENSILDSIFNHPGHVWEDIFHTAKTRKEYYERCDQRRQNAIDPEVAALYDKYKKKIHIGSDTETDDKGKPTGYYNPRSNQVYFNWQDDANNERGECSTYYHEVGHMVDDYLALFGDASSSRDFTRALKNDFENYVERTMRENNCGRPEAFRIISEWLWEDADNKSGVSDICDGLSNKLCNGRWGHDMEYWERGREHGIPQQVNNEAFAHFFEASMSTDSKKLDYLREIFPTAYREFKTIVRKNL